MCPAHASEAACDPTPQVQLGGSDDGKTALMLAIHTDVVKLLLDRGASTDVKDKPPGTALHAVDDAYLDDEKLELLLVNGASIDLKDEYGRPTKAAISMVVAFDEDQLGRMAAAQVHRLLPQGQTTDLVHAEIEVTEAAVTETTAKAVLQLVRLAAFSCATAPASCAPATRAQPKTTGSSSHGCSWRPPRASEMFPAAAAPSCSAAATAARL